MEKTAWGGGKGWYKIVNLIGSNSVGRIWIEKHVSDVISVHGESFVGMRYVYLYTVQIVHVEGETDVKGEDRKRCQRSFL